MLLRSSSAPILNSWLSSHSKDSSPEPEPVLHLPRTRSLSITQISFESDLQTQQKPIKKNPIPQSRKKRSSKTKANKVDQREVELKPSSVSSSSETQRLFSSSGLDEKLMEGEDCCGVGKKEGEVLQTLVAGGGAGRNGGKISEGSGSGNGSDGGGDGGNDGIGRTDAYYQKMIQADPGNGLVLGNYAKFLKEVRGDCVKAEEYCGRSILANPNDASVLSLYADLIWKTHKDAERAENYFDQAVKTSPDDCYVMASYAHFLWDAEDDEDDEENEVVLHETGRSLFHGATHHSPLTTAS